MMGCVAETERRFFVYKPGMTWTARPPEVPLSLDEDGDWVAGGGRTLWVVEGSLAVCLGHISNGSKPRAAVAAREFQHRVLPWKRCVFRSLDDARFHPSFRLGEVLRNVKSAADVPQCMAQCAYGLYFEGRMPEQHLWRVTARSNLKNGLQRLDLSTGQVVTLDVKDAEKGTFAIIQGGLWPSLQREVLRQGELVENVGVMAAMKCIRGALETERDAIENSVRHVACDFHLLVKVTWKEEFGLPGV